MPWSENTNCSLCRGSGRFGSDRCPDDSHTRVNAPSDDIDLKRKRVDKKPRR